MLVVEPRSPHRTALIFRVAVQDFTFSDGTFIPEGTFVAVAAREMHTDEKIYPGAKDFNPFRFSSTREENDGTEALESRYTMAGLGPSHIPFGYGKHAWCVLLSSTSTDVFPLLSRTP